MFFYIYSFYMEVAMTIAQKLAKAEKELAKLKKQAKVSTKKRVIDFVLGEYKGKPRLLIYPNGYDAEKESYWSASLDQETVRAMFKSELVEDFAS